MILKIAVAMAAAACLSLVPVYAAEVENGRGSTSKHNSTSAYRGSTKDRGAKSSKERSSNSSRGRGHGSRRASKATSKSRDASRSANKRNAARNRDNNAIQPDANVVVDLPSRDIDDVNDTELDGDQSAILLGTGNENEETSTEGGSPPL